MDFLKVPFVCVPIDVRHELKTLDIISHGYGNDWTMLAAQLGFNTTRVLSVKHRAAPHGSNTLKFLEEYSNEPNSTVGKVIEALTIINRPREIDLLKNSEDQILKSFNNFNNNGLYQLNSHYHSKLIKSTDFPLFSSENISFNTHHTDGVPNITQMSAYVDGLDSFPYSEERNSIQDNYDAITSVSGYARQPQTHYTKHQNISIASSSFSRGGNIDDFLLKKSTQGNIKHNFCENNTEKDYKMKNKRLLLRENSKNPSKFEPSLSDSCHRPVKNFGHIRVFVTYGHGDKAYNFGILNLCKSLDKMFCCNMDLKNHRLKKAKVDEYFERADVVLLCWNEQYKRTVNAMWLPNDEQDPRDLHTKYIYEKMVTEYGMKGGNNRFIPLLFQGAQLQDVPDWLRLSVSYHWPNQEKDMLSRLTRSQKTFTPSEISC